MALLKHNLCKAQNRMKQMADKKRSERSFNEGDWVYLKLQSYRQSSVALKPHPKLSAKYFGPYQILKKIGAVAYSLKLPPHSKIHATFHVSLLKKHHGPVSPTLDHSLPHNYNEDSFITKTPQSVLEVRSIKKNNDPLVQWLIQWTDCPREEATYMGKCNDHNAPVPSIRSLGSRIFSWREY